MNSESNSEVRGYILSVASSLLFACIPMYMQALAAIPGTTALLHRVFWQFAITLVFCLLVRRAALLAIMSDRRQLLVHLLTAPLIGIQWFLFVWAPVADRTVELAIGYLILPVSLTLTGVFVLSERLSKLKIAAVVFALAGLAIELSASGSVSWVSAGVFMLYPAYFVLHRLFRTPSSFGTLCVESGLVALVMFVWLGLAPGATVIPAGLNVNILLAGLGVLALAGMLCYLSASRLLPLHSFGLLSYLEPVLLFLVAFLFLDEVVQEGKLLSYGLFAFAFALVCFEGIRRAMTGGRQR